MEYTGFIEELKDNEIFVFGSNLEGKHGKGAALTAKLKFSAKQGVGRGLTGKCYAFPTILKLNPYTIAPLNFITKEVDILEECIKNNLNLIFLITEIGCGLARYKVEEIAPLFKKLQKYNNVKFPKSFYEVWT